VIFSVTKFRPGQQTITFASTIFIAHLLSGGRSMPAQKLQLRQRGLQLQVRNIRYRDTRRSTRIVITRAREWPRHLLSFAANKSRSLAGCARWG
jgi:hypothetical protein